MHIIQISESDYSVTELLEDTPVFDTLEEAQEFMLEYMSQNKLNAYRKKAAALYNVAARASDKLVTGDNDAKYKKLKDKAASREKRMYDLLAKRKEVADRVHKKSIVAK